MSKNVKHNVQKEEVIDRDLCIHIVNAFMGSMMDDKAVDRCRKLVQNIYVSESSKGNVKTKTEEEIEIGHMLRCIKSKAKGLDKKSLGNIIAMIDGMQKRQLIKEAEGQHEKNTCRNNKPTQSAGLHI